MSDDPWKVIRVYDAGLHESTDPSAPTPYILQGMLDARSLALLKCDNDPRTGYQRSVRPAQESGARALAQLACDRTQFAPLILGMRGQRFTSNENEYWLHDPVYEIDGQQRIDAALKALTHSGIATDLSVQVFFDTTREWESEKFLALHSNRWALAPSLLLRNNRHKCEMLSSLYGLTLSEKAFCLHQRVCWTQRKLKSELISALSFSKAVCRLHAHVADTAAGSATTVPTILPALSALRDIVGMTTVRDNARTFFELVNDCWGLRDIESKRNQPQTRDTFLLALARVLSDHMNFWRCDEKGRRNVLTVPRRLQERFKTFDLTNDEVIDATGSGGRAKNIVYWQMLDCFRKSNPRLQKWPAGPAPTSEPAKKRRKSTSTFRYRAAAGSVIAGRAK